jgi:UDP-N-acetyl-D-glucosamine dehydrogenase
MINIGMVNELALICDRLGIDVWEVIDAAATKPFGFMKFSPAPGWAVTVFRSIRYTFPGN